MDRLDFELLDALFRDPRAPYDALGSRVGLTGNAVKARLRRLEGDGLLQGFAAVPAPGHLGLAEGLLVFTHVDDLDEREEDLLRNLPDVSGVRYVDVTHDHSVVAWVHHAGEDDWERIERAAVSIVGKPPSWHVRLPPRPVERPLTGTDWKITRALLPDGRMALKDIVRRSKISSKTVKRRLDALLEEGALRIEPVLSTSEAGGAVLFSLVVLLHEGEDPRALLPLLPDTTIVRTQKGSRLAVYYVQRRTLREAQADHHAVKRSPLVERVLFEIATRRRGTHWLEEAATARIADALSPAPVHAAPTVEASPAPGPREPMPLPPPKST